MGKRPAREHTPAAATRKTAAQPPLDDDPRWIPIKAAVQARERQAGALRLAIVDLEDAMRSGRLRAMRRDFETGERAHMAAAFWQDHFIDVFEATGSVWFFCRSPERPADRPRRFGALDHFPDVRLDTFALYIWRPDLGKLFGVAGAPIDHDDDDDSATPPVKPGPKPRGNWPTLVEAWIAAMEKDGTNSPPNIDALMADAQIFLHNRLKWAPSNTKRLRKVIIEKLKLVRR
jgi:hypothetical protein